MFPFTSVPPWVYLRHDLNKRPNVNPFRTAVSFWGTIGGKMLGIRVACPQNGTGVLKGFSQTQPQRTRQAPSVRPSPCAQHAKEHTSFGRRRDEGMKASTDRRAFFLLLERSPNPPISFALPLLVTEKIVSKNRPRRRLIIFITRCDKYICKKNKNKKQKKTAVEIEDLFGRNSSLKAVCDTPIALRVLRGVMQEVQSVYEEDKI